MRGYHFICQQSVINGCTLFSFIAAAAAKLHRLSVVPTTAVSPYSIARH